MKNFARFVGIIALGLWVLGIGASAHSRADVDRSAASGEVERLVDSGDLGSVAIGEARRALKADMQDWSDDRDERRVQGFLVCGVFGGRLTDLVVRAWESR